VAARERASLHATAAAAASARRAPLPRHHWPRALRPSRRAARSRASRVCSPSPSSFLRRAAWRRRRRVCFSSATPRAPWRAAGSSRRPRAAGSVPRPASAAVVRLCSQAGDGRRGRRGPARPLAPARDARGGRGRRLVGAALEHGAARGGAPQSCVHALGGAWRLSGCRVYCERGIALLCSGEARLSLARCIAGGADAARRATTAALLRGAARVRALDTRLHHCAVAALRVQARPPPALPLRSCPLGETIGFSATSSAVLDRLIILQRVCGGRCPLGLTSCSTPKRIAVRLTPEVGAQDAAAAECARGSFGYCAANLVLEGRGAAVLRGCRLNAARLAAIAVMTSEAGPSDSEAAAPARSSLVLQHSTVRGKARAARPPPTLRPNRDSCCS
jgi:hypothetical protein